MKNLIFLSIFLAVPFLCFSQDADFTKYNNQINDVKKEVQYFEIEKITVLFGFT